MLLLYKSDYCSRGQITACVLRIMSSLVESESLEQP